MSDVARPSRSQPQIFQVSILEISYYNKWNPKIRRYYIVIERFIKEIVVFISAAMVRMAGKYILIVNGEKSAANATMATITALSRLEYIEYGTSEADEIGR